MDASPLYPLSFEPIFQYRLWGGRRLGNWMGKPLPDGPIGEAWVLSDRKDHTSKVANGRLRGVTISQLMAQSKTQILGEQAERFERFPLLLKFLDVNQMLSVQVHPRDDQASLIPDGDTGKTEAWVVLEADAESRIYAGLRPGTTAQQLRNLSSQTADEHLAHFTPQVGQGVQIEAGTVHSLGDGVMVFEVQENSDVTFRLYDWGHVDAKTGKPRDLQIDQALACIDLEQGPIIPVQPTVEAVSPDRCERYFDNAHFKLWRHESAKPFTAGLAGEARVLVCVEGAGQIEWAGDNYPMLRGGVTLLPAAVGTCQFRPDRPTVVLEIAATEPADQ